MDSRDLQVVKASQERPVTKVCLGLLDSQALTASRASLARRDTPASRVDWVGPESLEIAVLRDSQVHSPLVPCLQFVRTVFGSVQFSNNILSTQVL